jgi:hypothetical protein
MRPSAYTFHKTIETHFSGATFNGKPWLRLGTDDNVIHNWLLMFGPEALNIIPALLTYAASKTKAVIVPEVEEVYEAFLADIASTGHVIAAEGIRAWLEGEAKRLRSEAVFQVATVFPSILPRAAGEQVVARLSDDECSRLLAKIREKYRANV